VNFPARIVKPPEAPQAHGDQGSAAEWARAKMNLQRAYATDIWSSTKADAIRAKIKSDGPPPTRFFDRYGDGIDYGDYS
jgi:hypothetical protein